MTFADPGGSNNAGPNVKISTRDDTGQTSLPIPRELVFEFECNAESIDAAIAEIDNYVSGWAAIIAFAMNAPVGTPQVVQALDVTPDLHERSIREYVYQEDNGLPGPGRFIEPQLVGEVTLALHACFEEPRVARAVSQYEVALRYWTPNSLVLAAAHLYMACDALAPAIEESYRNRKSLTREQHAQEFGISIRGERCSECGTDRSWKVDLDRAARLKYIFQDDDELYQRSRKMSNAFEHGFTDIPEIRQVATEITARLFKVVRSAIFDVAEIDATTTAKLVDLEPIDASDIRYCVDGTLVGDVLDPETLAPDNQRWPRVDLKLSLDDLTFHGDAMKMTPRITMTANVRDGIAVQTKGLSWSPGLNTGAFLEITPPANT